MFGIWLPKLDLKRWTKCWSHKYKKEGSFASSGNILSFFRDFANFRLLKKILSCGMSRSKHWDFQILIKGRAANRQHSTKHKEGRKVAYATFRGLNLLVSLATFLLSVLCCAACSLPSLLSGFQNLSASADSFHKKGWFWKSEICEIHIKGQKIATRSNRTFFLMLVCSNMSSIFSNPTSAAKCETFLTLIL